METYVSLDELRLKPFEISENDADTKHLGVLQRVTKAMIDNVCGQTFELEGTADEPVEKKLDGKGSETIFFPYRLLELVKVRLYSTVTDYDEYDPEDFDVHIKWISWVDYEPSIRFLSAGTFPKGIANVGVLGVWGWQEIPYDIVYLQGKLIKKMVSNGEFANAMTSETIGDYSYTKEKAVNGEGGPFKDAELDAIVAMYSETVSYAAI